MKFEIGKYKVELEVDEFYVKDSSDNPHPYNKIYFGESEHDCTTKIGLKLFENERLSHSVIIGSTGSRTGIHENSQIVAEDRLLVCCSSSIFCLSIPELDLLWKTKADQASCFGVFKFRESYIVHGELEISRLDINGKFIWKQGGADVFTTPNGTGDFEITEGYVRATDWENRTYKFDFDGNLKE